MLRILYTHFPWPQKLGLAKTGPVRKFKLNDNKIDGQPDSGPIPFR